MIKVIHQGLGPIGRDIASLLLEDKNVEIVGAVDPRYAGKDLGELLNKYFLGIPIISSPEILL